MDQQQLHSIDLDQPDLPGFRQFISAWVYHDPNCTLLIDPGPSSSVPCLVRELKRLGVERLDYILLTHIHIDHAGGTGTLLQTFPDAQVICHPDGVAHLVAPEKLWQGSLKVLGKTAEIYGEILPVPAQQIGFCEMIGPLGVQAYKTPGHAPHHLCYLLDELLFAGEVAGVRCELAGQIYLRPATPPRFLLPVALASLDRMIALQPQAMIFAHYGRVDDAMTYLRIARAQLLLWVEGVKALAALPEALREEAFFFWLQERDAHYRLIDQLPEDIRSRERMFLGNTLQGMAAYVEGQL